MDLSINNISPRASLNLAPASTSLGAVTSNKEIAAGTPSDPPVIKLCGIGKSFPGVRALKDVSLGFWPGEVHMIMGENGAGKSTLMKILCGAYKADEGHFEHHGKRVEIHSTADAYKLGVSVIFQEYSLVPYLNVAQNIFLGREPRRRLACFVDHAKMHREARALMQRLGSGIDTHALVEHLSVAQQQVVEIAKALSQNAKVVVFDEPTAALSARETERLFELIGELRNQGVAMAYISHRMDEVFSLGDRVSVLREGQLIGSMSAGDATPERLVAMMVGRSVDMNYTRSERPVAGRTVLKVENLAGENGLKHATIDVRAGEIIGLAGLVGSGRTELVRTIFGADARAAGTVEIDGAPFDGTPAHARRRGVALIPEDRKRQGLALGRSVGQNLVLASLSRQFSSGWFRPQKARGLAASQIAELAIATAGPDKSAGKLSGGNQQKIVIGKWLLDEASLFIFDEPTRGIDIGAKEQIFALIDGLVRRGRAVLMISSEMGELVRVCDRVYVMKDMAVVKELKAESLDEESLVAAAMGGV